MLEIVLGSIITGAFIFGAILLLIYLLRWLLYDTTGGESIFPLLNAVYNKAFVQNIGITSKKIIL